MSHQLRYHAADPQTRQRRDLSAVWHLGSYCNRKEKHDRLDVSNLQEYPVISHRGAEEITETERNVHYKKHTHAQIRQDEKKKKISNISVTLSISVCVVSFLLTRDRRSVRRFDTKRPDRPLPLTVR